MGKGRANPEAELHPLLEGRFSTRAYDPGRPVPEEALRRCLEAARWAPSAYNAQPWRFVVADRFRDRESWERVFAQLIPINKRWCRNVPLFLVGIVDPLREGAPNPYAEYDLGQAVLSFCLQAVAEGLATRQMAGFDREGMQEVLQIPEPFYPKVTVAVGYPGDPERLDPDLRERELAPRVRRPLSEIAFFGRFG